MRWVALFSLLAIAYGSVACADGPSPRKEAPKPPSTTTLYKPPANGKPDGRIGAGTRGPAPFALVPSHFGATTESLPVLVWYLPSEAPLPLRCRLKLVDADAPDATPILDVEVPPPTRKGLQALRLSEPGGEFRTGRWYLWSLTLESESAGERESSRIGGGITRASIGVSVVSGPPAARAATLADVGLWYDAIAVLAESLIDDPDDHASRETLVRLLEEGGLPAIGVPPAPPPPNGKTQP